MKKKAIELDTEVHSTFIDVIHAFCKQINLVAIDDLLMAGFSIVDETDLENGGHGVSLLSELDDVIIHVGLDISTLSAYKIFITVENASTNAIVAEDTGEAATTTPMVNISKDIENKIMNILGDVSVKH